MMNNIIQNHINNVQKRFKKYNSLILKSKYDKSISDEFIKTYIDARYYDYGTDNNIKVFYRRIFDALKKTSNKLINENPKRKENIENHLELFQYYFYFDNVRLNVNIDQVIEVISQKRISKFNIKSQSQEEFNQEFSKVIREDISHLNRVLVSYDSNDFELDIRRIDTNNPNYYDVELAYNFDFPNIFSDYAIEETFNSDIIAEDKLFVEYPMIANRVLIEILNCNFSRIYVCDFSAQLLKKKQKLSQILETINNQIAQEKICLKINYKDFVKNKSEIFNLIKKGFSFALITDDDMPELSNEEIKIMEVFACIIVSNNDVNKEKYKNAKILQK